MRNDSIYWGVAFFEKKLDVVSLNTKKIVAKSQKCNMESTQ